MESNFRFVGGKGPFIGNAGAVTGGGHWSVMTQHFKHARLATTAIAAALAFTSTPLLAQEAAPPPVTDQPAAPAEPSADPLAPESAPAETTATPTASKAAPAKAKAAPTVRKTASTTRSTTVRSVTRSQSPAPAPVAEAPATVPPATATAPAVPEITPGPMPVAEPTPAVEPATQTAAIDMDEALPIAGGAALGLFLLGGVAAVRRRQRRKQEDADEAAKLAFIDAAEHEHTLAEPVVARTTVPQHDPIPPTAPIAGAPTTDLPEGFDLSRFGRHVQAAYQGPTEDNPSLSLKHRVRRASFLDQQERRTGVAAPAQASAHIPAKGNWESRGDADFLFYRAGKKPAPKPALQD